MCEIRRIVYTLFITRTTGHSPQLPIRTSTAAGAGTQVRSPVAGCPVSNSVHQPVPEEAESTAASAADSAAASGTGGRPRGAPARGIKKKSPRSGSSHQDDRMQVNLSEYLLYVSFTVIFSLKDV